MESYLTYSVDFCGSISFIPKEVTVYKAIHAKDISLKLFLMLTADLYIGFSMKY
jgi:hypothetical protein